MAENHKIVGRSTTRQFLLLGLMVLAVLTISLFIGRYPEPYWMPPSYLWRDELAQRLVLNLRLPRILTAFIMGMSLGASGAVLQMIFRNPLVSPGFLGVSQGAAFGAAVSIIYLGRSPLMIEASATLFAFSGLIISYLLARNIRYGKWVLRLILAGIATSALFSSGVGVLKYLADPLSELPDIVFWLLGGLWSVTWRDLLYILPVVLVALGVLFLMRWRINLLALRDETAFSLGVAPSRERVLVLVAAVAATAVVVAVAGVVGWVGLIVPHIARLVVGPDTRRALPASMLIGGIFALICDNLARTLLAGEIPLGILTSLAGALLFVWVFLSGHRWVRG
ncbi:MAG: iron ABC transporter permease [Anaerolineaceae bacterium]|nr:MAG: iron ABC transporter permease [Anaerolineaceae bacterium]